ncbi:hypothetical protein Tco_1569440 [Tanacetum coccineum]
MIARGVPNQAKRYFKNFTTTRASLVGSAFASTHFDKFQLAHRDVLVPRADGTVHEIDAPHVKDLAHLNCILRHFITLRDFPLIVDKVSHQWTKSMGISVNR